MYVKPDRVCGPQINASTVKHNCSAFSELLQKQVAINFYRSSPASKAFRWFSFFYHCNLRSVVRGWYNLIDLASLQNTFYLIKCLKISSMVHIYTTLSRTSTSKTASRFPPAGSRRASVRLPPSDRSPPPEPGRPAVQGVSASGRSAALGIEGQPARAAVAVVA